MINAIQKVSSKMMSRESDYFTGLSFIGNKKVLRRGLLVLLLILSCVVSIFVGVVEISITDVLTADAEKLFIISASRFPRTISLVLAGVGMSISGLIMQQLTRNKFVSPTTAGALDAAQLGLLLALILLPSAGTLMKGGFAFVFTFGASLLFLKIINSIRIRNVIFVPLVGLMFGAILNSVATFFAVNLNIVQDVNAWMMADFSGVLSGKYEMIYFSLPAVVITYVYASKFTLIGMGEDFAKNLGLNYQSVMNLGLFSVSLAVSSIVITAGAIPFLGLVVPNLVTMVYGDNIKNVLPEIALSGAIFLLVCDIVGRLVIYPFEIPIGLMVGILGGAIFLIMLLRRR